MGMLKGDSTALNFDQLMAQATQVAKQQDASLMERARQKRREDEERRRRELKAQREREEAQALLAKKRELQDKKQKSLLEQKKQSREIDRKRQQVEKTTKSRTSSAFGTSGMSSSNSSSSRKSSTTAISNLLAEKKKPVHMSFDDLMKKAKEQSLGKAATKDKPSHSPPSSLKKQSDTSRSQPGSDHYTPTIYNRQKKPEPTRSSSATLESTMSARDRARQLIAEPPKKVSVQKRDRRTIADVQRDIRRSRGIRSDDEDERPRDARLSSARGGSIHGSARPASKYISPPPLPVRKRPLSPPSSRPVAKRPLPPPVDRRPAAPPVKRMPFSGRPLDPAARRAAVASRRRYRDEEDEEEDEELASFIVDDEDEDPRYARGPRRNSYSDEISKIFRYDRSRYANDPVYSDDDMEANALDVLREEKRSERIARREDQLEEQKELERLERLKKKKRV